VLTKLVVIFQCRVTIDTNKNYKFNHFTYSWQITFILMRLKERYLAVLRIGLHPNS